MQSVNIIYTSTRAFDMHACKHEASAHVAKRESLEKTSQLQAMQESHLVGCGPARLLHAYQPSARAEQQVALLATLPVPVHVAQLGNFEVKEALNVGALLRTNARL
jgi:hypothetical protein